MVALKSCTAFPNQMRRMKKDVKPLIKEIKNCGMIDTHGCSPMTKPKTPIHAEIFWRRGLSSTLEALPNLCRNDIAVKVRKNMAEKVRAMTIKTGADALGGDKSRWGALSGSAVKSRKVASVRFILRRSGFWETYRMQEQTRLLYNLYQQHY